MQSDICKQHLHKIQSKSQSINVICQCMYMLVNVVIWAYMPSRVIQYISEPSLSRLSSALRWPSTAADDGACRPPPKKRGRGSILPGTCGPLSPELGYSATVDAQKILASWICNPPGLCSCSIMLILQTLSGTTSYTENQGGWGQKNQI